MKALIVPNMVTSLVADDYRRIFEIPLTNPKMDDERRTIHEEDDEGAGTSTQAFLVKSGGLPLGNHSHNNKVEVFFLLCGEVERLITLSLGEEKKEFSHIPSGSMIVMPPGVVHTFFLSPGSRMLCYASERFDPNDMPTMKLA